MILKGSILLCLLLISTTDATSWLDRVGMAGSARVAGTFPARHVCLPGKSCQGLPTLPCPGTVVSNPRASIFLNEALYLHWNLNGSNPADTMHTCVQIGIAPFRKDPSFADFTTLEECLPFSHGSSGIDTDAYVMIPASVPSGEYTVLWEWTRSGETYTSCADITINAISVPRPDVNPMPQANTQSCTLGTPDADSYCRARFGFQSYCRSWKKDACDRSFCFGQTELSDTDCSTIVLERDMSNLLKALAAQKKETDYDEAYLLADVMDAYQSFFDEDESYLYDRIYTLNGCLGLPSDYCQSRMGIQSYCQPKAVDACGRALCQGDLDTCKDVLQETEKFETA